MSFRTFTRNWYKWQRTAPTVLSPKGGRRLVPGPGRKNYTGQTFSLEHEARAACSAYNEANEPGALSHKMEYERF